MGYVGCFGPSDVAEAVAFLASEEAGYITEQVLGVDGGSSSLAVSVGKTKREP